MSSPGRQFTSKNPSRPDDRRAGRISAGKLSAGETFLKGDPIMGHRRLVPLEASSRVLAVCRLQHKKELLCMLRAGGGAGSLLDSIRPSDAVRTLLLLQLTIRERS